MNELVNIQNDVFFACKLICFIALVIAGGKIGIKLYQGEEVEDRMFNMVLGIAAVLGFSYLLDAFIN